MHNLIANYRFPREYCQKMRISLKIWYVYWSISRDMYQHWSKTHMQHQITSTEEEAVCLERFHQALLGGDQLTVARVRSCQRGRASSDCKIWVLCPYSYINIQPSSQAYNFFTQCASSTTRATRWLMYGSCINRYLHFFWFRTASGLKNTSWTAP